MTSQPAGSTRTPGFSTCLAGTTVVCYADRVTVASLDPNRNERRTLQIALQPLQRDNQQQPTVYFLQSRSTQGTSSVSWNQVTIPATGQIVVRRADGTELQFTGNSQVTLILVKNTRTGMSIDQEATWFLSAEPVSQDWRSFSGRSMPIGA